MAHIHLFSAGPWQQFYERHPNAVLWMVAAVQAAVVLSIYIVLHWLLS